MGEIKSKEMIRLEPNECWSLLRSCEVGRVAMSTADHPHIFPVNFVVDHGSIVFRTADGTKLAESVLGRPVAFEVDGYDAGLGEAWSVVIKGSAREIEGMHELFDATDLPLFPWHAGPKHHYVRIDPVEVTGRRFGVIDSSRAARVGTGAHRAAPE